MVVESQEHPTDKREILKLKMIKNKSQVKPYIVIG